MTTEPPRPPDQPPVRRPRRSLAAAVLAGFGVLIVGGYAAFAFGGHELGTPKRDEIPASVRSSPGGYRTYHFWHSGYHGGK